VGKGTGVGISLFLLLVFSDAFAADELIHHFPPLGKSSHATFASAFISTNAVPHLSDTQLEGSEALPQPINVLKMGSPPSLLIADVGNYPPDNGIPSWGVRSSPWDHTTNNCPL